LTRFRIAPYDHATANEQQEIRVIAGSGGGARRISGLCIPLGFCIQLALAADEPADCAAIESPDERLACFDAAYRSGTEAPPATESEPVDRGAAEPAASVVVPAAAAAGAARVATPSEADFGIEKPKSETEGESMVSGIAAVSRDGYDKLIFELDNGQVWRQTEYKRFLVKPGQVAEIRHGSFGSYKLYIQGKKSWTRVRRSQ